MKKGKTKITQEKKIKKNQANHHKSLKHELII
jgi:hypothetical protein